MSNKNKQSVDAALDSIREIVGQSKSKRQRPRTIKRSIAVASAYLVAILAAVVLPFFLLLRVATSLYLDSSLNHWVAIAFGMGASGIVLLLYAQFVATKIGLGKFVANGAGRFVAVLVLAYCSYGLLYLSAENAKTDQVASTYTRLHPILRLSLSTLLLVDRDAILTDTERSASDYGSMGLSPMERSLHYRQSDGYAHAVDLRTIGRSELRNSFIAAYFRILGFRTLRHIGTADHLHISLPLNT